jgi:predicted MFS family arabinose efflux permease
MGRGPGHRFRLFLVGQTVNGLGSMVTAVALPLVAVQRLHASTFDVGLLEAVEWVPALVIGLHVGALIDRHQHRARTVMMAANLGQAAALAAVPIAASSDVLTFGVLLGVALTAGMFGVFFQTGYFPFLRELVPTDDYIAANSRLQAGRAAGSISGPALGGALVEIVGSATTLLADAASFVVSFISLVAVKPPRRVAVPIARRPLLKEVAEGLRYLRDSPLLLTIATATALANLFLTAIGAVEIVFLVRAVHVPDGIIGALFAASGTGGLTGALIAHQLISRVGLERIARTALAITAPAALLIPLAHHGLAVSLFAIGGFVVSFGLALAGIALTSLRLLHTPADLQGRMTSSSRFLIAATIPAGALLGGTLGQLIGNGPALYAMAAAYTAFGVTLLRSPLQAPAPVLHEAQTA